MSVTLYSRTPCQPCKATKRAFEKKGIKFEEISTNDNPEATAIVKNLGYLKAPVVVTENGHWGGFQPDKIDELAASFATA